MPESLRVSADAESIAVFRGAEESPLVVQNAHADRRPFIHPLLVPGRNVSLTENAPPHHAWQHGLYIGLNDVNGIGLPFAHRIYVQRCRRGEQWPPPTRGRRCVCYAKHWAR